MFRDCKLCCKGAGVGWPRLPSSIHGVIALLMGRGQFRGRENFTVWSVRRRRTYGLGANQPMLWTYCRQRSVDVLAGLMNPSARRRDLSFMVKQNETQDDIKLMHRRHLARLFFETSRQV